MKSFAAFICFALCAICWPADAIAQHPEGRTGSRLPEPVRLRPVQDDYALNVSADFARCVWRHEQDKVLLLLENSDSHGIDLEAAGIRTSTIDKRFSMERCLELVMGPRNNTLYLTMPPLAFRRVMLETAYLESYPVSPAWLTADFTPAERRFVFQQARPAAILLGLIADCLVAADPAAADALLRTQKNSDAEAMAVGAVAQHLGPCVPEGQTLELQIAHVRHFVAEGLWHRANSYRQQVASVRPESNLERPE